MASIPGGTTIEATSSKQKKVSFKKSKGTAEGTKTAIESAVKPAFESGEYANPELVTALAIALHGGTSKKPVSITLEEAQAKLKEILDNPKKRAAPVKKAAGEAAAPAPKKGEYAKWTKEVKAGLVEGEPFDSIIAGAVWRNSSKNYEASKEEAIRQMKEKAPEKAAAAAAKRTEAQRAAAEAKAAKEAEHEAERQRKAAELAARKLRGPAGPAGPAGRNEAWEAEVEEEFERCVAACESTKAEKLATGRAAYTQKRATAAKKAGPAGAAAENNSGESLSDEEAWTKFTEGLPADIAAFVSTSKQKASLLKTPQFKAWVLVYASSVSKGTTELNKYRESIKKAVGKKLEAAKAALAAAGNGGAARKRRASGNAASRGGGKSRKNRSSRKNRKTRRGRN
jgi:hypothetical protein